MNEPPRLPQLSQASDHNPTLDEQLFLACISNNIDDFKSLIEKGANINSYHPFTLPHQLQLTDLYPPDKPSTLPLLYVATISNSIEIIDVIIQHLTSLGDPILTKIQHQPTENNYQLPLLCFASHINTTKVSTIQHLLTTYHFDPYMKSNCGSTLLHFAAFGYNIELIDYYITLGLDVNYTNGVKAPILVELIHKMAITTTLPPPEITLIMDIIQYLLKLGADPNNFITTPPLILCAQYNLTTLTKSLIQYNADINIRDKIDSTPLIHAVCCAHVETVEVLLQYDYIDINASNMNHHNALHCAIVNDESIQINNNVKIVELLCKNGVDVNIIDGSKLHAPLIQCVIVNAIRCAEILLDYNVKIHSKDQNNNTPIHYAASLGNFKFIDLLLRYGADIDVLDDQFQTPLYTTLKSKDATNRLNDPKSTVSFLITKRANINHQSGDACTPIMTALTCCDTFHDIVEILIIACVTDIINNNDLYYLNNICSSESSSNE